MGYGFTTTINPWLKEILKEIPIFLFWYALKCYFGFYSLIIGWLCTSASLYFYDPRLAKYVFQPGMWVVIVSSVDENWVQELTEWFCGVEGFH